MISLAILTITESLAEISFETKGFLRGLWWAAKWRLGLGVPGESKASRMILTYCRSHGYAGADLKVLCATWGDQFVVVTTCRERAGIYTSRVFKKRLYGWSLRPVRSYFESDIESAMAMHMQAIALARTGLSVHVEEEPW